MLEKIAVAAVENAPTIAKLSDDAFIAMKSAVQKMGGAAHEIEGTQVAGRMVTVDGKPLAHFNGHSTIHEGDGVVRLLSEDGAKLQLTRSGADLELVDGTIISHEGKTLTTKLPGGDVVRQEKVGQDHIITTLNGRVLPHRFGEKLPDGAHIQNGEKHASSLSLRDGTHVGNDTYGVHIYRGVNPASYWAGGQAPLTLETRYFKSGVPHLTLHNPLEENMFSSSFLSANAERGIAIRTAQEWKWLRDLIK